MRNRTQVTLIDRDGTSRRVSLPRKLAERLEPGELFDVAYTVAEHIDYAPISPKKAQEQEVDEFLRWFL